MCCCVCVCVEDRDLAERRELAYSGEIVAVHREIVRGFPVRQRPRIFSCSFVLELHVTVIALDVLQSHIACTVSLHRFANDVGALPHISATSYSCYIQCRSCTLFFCSWRHLRAESHEPKDGVE